MLGAEAPPLCQHLVACVLAENCGSLFESFLVEESLGLELVELSVWRKRRSGRG